MPKNDNINLKLEVCKDKISGKLSITAHFDSNAPNVIENNDGIYWIPTYEENNFINEAFQLIQPDVQYSPPAERNQRMEEKRETKETFSDLPPLKRQKEPTVFERNNETNRDHTPERDVFQKKDDFRENRYEPDRAQYKPQEKEIKRKEEKIIMEADSKTIDDALKKHLHEDSSSFVEVDEQTIIDKVLSQKKKGKWNIK